MTSDGVTELNERLTPDEREQIEAVIRLVADMKRVFVRRHKRIASDNLETRVEFDDGQQRRVVDFESGDVPVRSLQDLLGTVLEIEARAR